MRSPIVYRGDVAFRDELIGRKSRTREMGSIAVAG
jgi:hypothetical protein